jgi:SnoaL-like domain
MPYRLAVLVRLSPEREMDETSATLIAWVKQARDREQIDAVLVRYFAGLDENRPDLVDSCFAPDARMYVDDVLIRGPGSALPESASGLSFSSVRATTHVMGQRSITVDGDSARVDTRAVAYLLAELAEGDRLLIRGLRYHDTFTRSAGAWLVAERRHQCDWMFVADPSFAVPADERWYPND